MNTSGQSLACVSHVACITTIETFDKDASVLLNRIEGHSGLLRGGYYENDGSVRTKQLLKQYFGELNLYQKLAVICKLSLDIDFYYHVFPTEEDTHKYILGIDYDIPRPYLRLYNAIYSDMYHVLLQQ